MISIRLNQKGWYFGPDANMKTGGGELLSIMAYTRRLRMKGVPFSGFQYVKG